MCTIAHSVSELPAIVNQCYNCLPSLDFPTNPCHTNSMKTNNHYVNNLLEMGYDIKDTHVPASKVSANAPKKTFPCVIHGRQFDTEEQYLEELNEFMCGM